MQVGDKVICFRDGIQIKGRIIKMYSRSADLETLEGKKRYVPLEHIKPLEHLSIPNPQPENLTLTHEETQDLTQLENKVCQGLVSFIEMGRALRQIRDRRLYRKQYSAFEQYCQISFGLTRQRVNQLIAAASVIDNLETQVVKNQLPSSEKQVRPMVKLEPRLQVAVWQKLLEKSQGIPSTKQIQSEVTRILIIDEFLDDCKKSKLSLETLDVEKII